MIENFRVAVCIPARDQMHTATTYSLWNLCELLARIGVESRLFISAGTLICNQRHNLVESAKEWGATHVMFIDSDIEFEPYHVVDLLEFDQPIVGAAYSKRVEPLLPTAWYNIDDWDSWVKFDEVDETHIQVEAMALGFCLIRMDVFDIIPKPWFVLGYHEGQYTGEDIEFFRMCNEQGFKIWLDVQTSCEIGHIGSKSYKIFGDADVGFSIS
jgi:hypothetical protein